MFARLTYIKPLPEHVALIRQTFIEKVVPLARQHRGLIHIMLLEPTEKGDEFICVTEWETRREADDYENSGTYEELIRHIRGLIVREPVLKTFTIQLVGAMRPVEEPLY